MIDGDLRGMIDESLPVSLNPQRNAPERSTGKCNAPARMACARAHIDGSDAGAAGCGLAAVALAADAEDRASTPTAAGMQHAVEKHHRFRSAFGRRLVALPAERCAGALHR